RETEAASRWSAWKGCFWIPGINPGMTGSAFGKRGAHTQPCHSGPHSRNTAQNRPNRHCPCLAFPLARPELSEITQPLPDFTLETPLAGLVGILPPDRLGEILLPGNALGRVVVVDVALAVACRFHQLGRCVEDGHGRGG